MTDQIFNVFDEYIESIQKLKIQIDNDMFIILDSDGSDISPGIKYYIRKLIFDAFLNSGEDFSKHDFNRMSKEYGFMDKSLPGLFNNIRTLIAEPLSKHINKILKNSDDWKKLLIEKLNVQDYKVKALTDVLCTTSMPTHIVSIIYADLLHNNTKFLTDIFADVEEHVRQYNDTLNNLYQIQQVIKRRYS